MFSNSCSSTINRLVSTVEFTKHPVAKLRKHDVAGKFLDVETQVKIALQLPWISGTPKEQQLVISW